MSDRWRELRSDLDDFQKILKLLVDFDQKTGRYTRYSDVETHWMRHAIAECSAARLRVFLRHCGGFAYAVVCECRTTGGMVATYYVHEDGIRIERDAQPPDHPVHKIKCMTDLFEASASEPGPRETLNSFTLSLLDTHARESAS